MVPFLEPVPKFNKQQQQKRPRGAILWALKSNKSRVTTYVVRLLLEGMHSGFFHCQKVKNNCWIILFRLFWMFLDFMDFFELFFEFFFNLPRPLQ
jgi:hypothetical protein